MKLWQAFVASALLFAAIGCGGGGGGTSSTGGNGGGGGDSTVNLFATDNLVQGYDHVFVSVKRVELIGENGTRVLFDEPAGRVIDLRSLRDATGRRFRLLSNRAVSSGRYTGIRVTVGEEATIFTTGATAGTTANFEGAAAGNKVLALDFATPRQLGGRSHLIVDFDLANWDLTGTTISATNGAYLAVVEDNSLGNIDRHDRDEYKGLISNLSGTAPTQTFTLGQGTGTVVVKTDANTAIFNENGALSPTLTNGTRVEVYGAFSSTENALIASRIKIDNENDNDEDEVKGRVTAFDAAANSITLDIFRSSGFVPTTTTITVSYADTVRVFGRRGARFTLTEFEAALANGQFLEVEGTLNGDTLVARKLKVEDGDDRGGHHGGGGGGDNDGEAEVRGTASNVNATAFTFTIAAFEWEGLILQNGQTVSITTSGGTEFKVNGNNVSRATFFSSLNGATAVKVEGTYDPDTRTLAATEAKIGDNGGGGGDDDDNDDDN